MLHAKEPRGFHVEPAVADVAEDFHDDLPWFLNDLRPSGFLGRLVPRRHPDLGLPPDIRSWTSDHCLAYLCRHGWNMPGNLVVGDEAFGLFLSGTSYPHEPVHEEDRARRYPDIAADVLAAGPPGSSSAGEQPKFLVDRASGPVPLLVKFSPPARDETSRRLADLLWCEHLAHDALLEAGRPAARSGIFEAGGRVFLEVERFDRAPPSGRRGLISLQSLDSEFVGGAISWTATASALAGLGVIDRRTLREVRWLECFGRLIGNTDMHLGNVSFLAAGTRVTGIAPAYDMLPMQYAPQAGHLPDIAFRPAAPGPSDADVWEEAHAAALGFWARVAAHPQVSGGFRAIARSNLSEIEALAVLARMLPR